MVEFHGLYENGSRAASFTLSAGGSQRPRRVGCGGARQPTTHRFHDDGGGTWKEASVGGELTREIRRIRFADALHGWALGPRAIFYTDDGGGTWKPQYTSAEGVWLNELSVLSPDRVLAVGGWGFLLRTNDHGVTWSRVPWNGKRDFLWAIAFADQRNGWLAVNDAIFSTRKGGDTWVCQASPVEGMLSEIAVTPSRVFITGGSSRVLTSQR
jgi:hypothetical protein